MKAKYVRTNIVAVDCQKLADFYICVFGCRFVPPERDCRGGAPDAATGLDNARLRVVHLRLPGYGDDGPTVEIYSYASPVPRQQTVNRPGIGHLAFQVEDVHTASREVIAHGGREMGEITTLATKVGTKVTWCYMADPEGNIVELQSWS